MIGSCLDPGRQNAQCRFTPAPKVPLTVVTAAGCRTCKTDDTVAAMKRQITGLSVATVNYPSAKADSLIRELNLPGLPVYLFGKEIEREKGFENLKQNLEPAAGYYMLKPEVAGLGFFLNRKKLNNRFDVFISLANPGTAQLLEVIREFDPKIHFLVMDDGQSFQAAGGAAEIEEALRAVCVQKQYPQSFYNYISCRAGNPQSAWWEDCIQEADASAVKLCARGPEGVQLLRDNVALNRELAIANGPTYLMNNQEVFGSNKVPDKEELRAIITR